jgi:hypothetical protein
MRSLLNPNRAANPLLWLLVTSILIGIGNCTHQTLQRTTSKPPPPQTVNPLRDTPEHLVQQGYARLRKVNNQTSRDITYAIARGYLQEANQQKQPLLWLRSQYNNALYDLKTWQNAKLEYSRADAETLAASQTKVAALAFVLNAITQNQTAQIDNNINLRPIAQEGDNFFSLLDAQVIERRYPHD